MNLLIAPDSYKGCLTSSEVCSAILKGINAVGENVNVMQFPSSDGGEGFCSCMRSIFGGDLLEREVTYPLGNKGKAEFLYNTSSSTAYIELASCAGLSLVLPENRNILASTTYGLGELIREAVCVGAKKIVIGLGGSATNDCGIGLLSALGVRFFDKNNNEVLPYASSLNEVAFADKSQMIDLAEIDLVAACDVRNPLCGKNGAAEVFARQKGATEFEVAWLDKSALSFANALNIDSNVSGCGAAGGVGFALIGFLGAEYVSGASLLVNSEPFNKALRDADLLITGEGNTDAQTLCGKLVSVVIEKAKEYNVPSLVISGGLSEGYENIFEKGAVGCYSLSKDESDREYCINHAFELLTEKTSEIMLKYISK